MKNLIWKVKQFLIGTSDNVDYDKELPLAEPDVTDKDFRKFIVEKFYVADFNSCPKCGINDKNCIGFNTRLFYDYLETFKKYREVSVFCHECKYQTRPHRDFEGCLDEWNSGVCNK